MKSKNYRNVSGYVELEFTEAVAGFWGMRFPGERATAPSAPVAAAPARPAAPVAPVAQAPIAPKVDAPAPANAAPRVEPKPAAPRPAAPVAPAAIPAANLPQPASQPVASAPSCTDFCGASGKLECAGGELKTDQLVAVAEGSRIDRWMWKRNDFVGSDRESSASAEAPVSKPPVSNVVPSAPTPQVSANVQTTTPDVLRRESEKLQEQLATMLLGDEAKSVPAAPVAPVSKVVEIPRQQNQPAKPVVAGEEHAIEFG